MLVPVEGSEIEAMIDIKALSPDLVSRPVMINQDHDFLNLTVADARRLLDFLNDAIPYMEGKIFDH